MPFLKVVPFLNTMEMQRNLANVDSGWSPDKRYWSFFSRFFGWLCSMQCIKWLYFRD